MDFLCNGGLLSIFCLDKLIKEGGGGCNPKTWEENIGKVPNKRFLFYFIFIIINK